MAIRPADAARVTPQGRGNPALLFTAPCAAESGNRPEHKLPNQPVAKHRRQHADDHDQKRQHHGTQRLRSGLPLPPPPPPLGRGLQRTSSSAKRPTTETSATLARRETLARGSPGAKYAPTDPRRSAVADIRAFGTRSDGGDTDAASNSGFTRRSYRARAAECSPTGKPAPR